MSGLTKEMIMKQANLPFNRPIRRIRKIPLLIGGWSSTATRLRICSHPYPKARYGRENHRFGLKQGANNITDIRFGLHSSRDYWSKALATAGANTVSDTKAIAAAKGVCLIRVLSISLNHTQVRSPQLNMASFVKIGGSDHTPPIEAGDVSIETNVSLVYEIE